MIKVLDRISEMVQIILQGILGVICMVLLVVNLAQIIGRYVFFYSLPWSEELSTYLFIWIIFLGVHLLVKEDAELRIDTVAFKDARKQLILECIRDVISLTTMLIFLWACIIMIQNSIAYPQRAASLPINSYYIYSVMPVGYVLITYQKVANLIKRLVQLKTNNPPAVQKS